MVKTPDANIADAGGGSLIPRLGRSPGGGNGKSIPVFLPGESHGLKSLVGYIPGVTESWTRLKELSMYAHTLL